MWQSSSVPVKDRVVLTMMASLELCTDRISGFMGLNKTSSFCNYFIEPHLPTSCDTFTFGGENEAEGQDFIPGAGPNLDLVRTYEWLSYVKVTGSEAYDVLVSFFPCKVYIDSSRCDTLGYGWQLVIIVIS
jgi:hypothetical protein